MEKALENIRRRVDAFGVGEPDIFLSGDTIEVQIPGLTESTVEERSVDPVLPRRATTRTTGAAPQAEAQTALDGLEVTTQPAEVCIVTPRDDEELDCLRTEQQADAALAGTRSARDDVDAAPRPSASPPPKDRGPGVVLPHRTPTGAADCFDSKTEADEALKALETEVTQRDVLHHPAHRVRTTTRSRRRRRPRPPRPASATPSPRPSSTAFVALDRTDAEDLPCEHDDRGGRRERSTAIGVALTMRYCVVSSAGEDLGLLPIRPPRADSARPASSGCST